VERWKVVPKEREVEEARVLLFIRWRSLTPSRWRENVDTLDSDNPSPEHSGFLERIQRKRLLPAGDEHLY
jgi:hypothetical protein